MAKFCRLRSWQNLQIQGKNPLRSRFSNSNSQAARVWPLEKQRTRSTPQVAPKKNLTFYEASGLQKCGDVEKSSTILQYFLEGRIQTGLLNLVRVKSRYQSKLSELIFEPENSN